MFKCEKCEQSSDRPHKVVVERKMVNHLGGEIPKGPRGGRGSQIVRELTLCETCKSSTPEAFLERAEPVAQEKLSVTFEELEEVA